MRSAYKNENKRCPILVCSLADSIRFVASFLEYIWRIKWTQQEQSAAPKPKGKKRGNR